MTKALTFLGELELAQDQLQNPDFADFERLPYKELIQSLAMEFAGDIELMPYQKDGDKMRLLVSVYLQPKDSSGKVIAVLTRGLYPQDMQGIMQLVDIAARRLSSLETIACRFKTDSLLSAQENLKRLSIRIAESL
jgi:hypothetical protein